MVRVAKKRRRLLSSDSLLATARAWTMGISLTAFSLAPVPTFACAFDMVKPERTQIDRIVDAETLVLARPNDSNPYSFDTFRLLYGDIDRPPINQLVDSTTRRKLAANPLHSVLFAYEFETGWSRVAFVDDDFSDVLDAALAHRIAWQTGMTQSRIDFISALQNSSTPAKKAIVIGELDKVPYAELQKFDLRISDSELLADLWSRSGYPYQATRALLLGLSGTPSARAEIQDYIDRVADWSWANNLGAFAAAFIELEGVAGIEKLADTMLLDLGQPLDKIEQIVMAMSVHHDLADPQLKSAIQDAIHTLVSERAEAGAAVARQFSLRSDWSQAEVLEPLVRERKVALNDLVTISVYLGRTRAETTDKTGMANE